VVFSDFFTISEEIFAGSAPGCGAIVMTAAQIDQVPRKIWLEMWCCRFNSTTVQTDRLHYHGDSTTTPSETWQDFRWHAVLSWR
jgi:hypothetical protein